MATHFMHWMHTASSHTGISSARLRFSYRAVAVGNVPSHGNALTGKSSPRPAASLPMTSWTYLGAMVATGGAIGTVLVTWPFRETSWRLARVLSTAWMFFWRTS